MYQCVHYIKYTSIYKVHVPMCPLYKEVPLYTYFLHHHLDLQFLWLLYCSENTRVIYTNSFLLFHTCVLEVPVLETVPGL